MRNYLFIILLLSFLAACQNQSTKVSDVMPALFSVPKTVPLDTVNGYAINLFTGDSIKPFFSRKGDEIITGKPFPVQGKIIPLADLPEPTYVSLAPPTLIPMDQLEAQVTYDTTAITVDSQSLKTVQFVVDSSSFFVVENTNDTISSGVELPITGAVIPLAPPKPTKALPFQFSGGKLKDMEHLGLDQRLPSASISSMVVDKNGIFWFSSRKGLTKYDGTYFWHYGKKEGLPGNNAVGKLDIDSKGNLWFNTGAGICRYDGQNLVHFSVTNQFYPKNILHFYIDNQDNIWAGSYRHKGAFKFAFDDASFTSGSEPAGTITYFTQKEGIINATVTSIVQDRNGDMWLGTYAQGLCRFDGKQFFHYTDKNDLLRTVIGKLLEDKNGNIWVGHENGISKFDGQQFTNYNIKDIKDQLGYVEQIHEDEEGNIWFSAQGILYKFDGQQIINYSKLGDLPKVIRMKTILQDAQKNMWVSVPEYGIIKFNDLNFTHLPVEETVNIYNFGMHEIEKEKRWFHHTAGGIFKLFLDANGEKQKEYLLNYNTIRIYSLLFHSKGNLWAGSMKGLLKFEFQDDETHPIKGYWNYGPEQGIIGIAMGLTEDSSGDIWFGAFNSQAIIKYDGTNFIKYEESCFEYGANNIKEDKSGNIWLGLPSGFGKLTLNKNTNKDELIIYSQKEGLPFNFVSTSIFDKKGNIWGSGNHTGVFKFDGHQTTYFTRQTGLTDNSVLSLLEDSNENIWVGTEEGLNYILPNKSNSESEPKEVIINFDRKSGLQDQNFTISSKLLLDSENRAWFGLKNKITAIDLDDFSFERIPPKVHLNNIDINGELIDFRNLDKNDLKNIEFDSIKNFSNCPHELSLPYDANHLTFYFSAIDWNAPEKIQYSYRMQGGDNKWSELTNEPKVDFRNMEYGDYTFQVRAIGQGRIWSEPQNYSFTILPPWWHTWWARMAYVIAGVLLILGYNRWRTRQLIQKQIILKKQVAEATVEITAAKEKAEESERFKQQFLANMSHEIRTPMHAISGMTKIIKRNDPPKEQEVYLNAIHQSANNLLVILNDVLDLSKIEAGKIDLESIPMSLHDVVKNVMDILRFKAEDKGLKLISTIAENVPDQVMGDPTRLSQIIINLAGNAIKFTDSGHIKISIEKLENDQFRFAVKDTGIGIPSSKLKSIFGKFEQVDETTTRRYGGTGLGLSISKQLVELKNGKIWVESEEGKGSTFLFDLPLVAAVGKIAETKELTESELKEMGTSLGAIKILLVDDNDFNLMIAEDDLTHFFPTAIIDTATNGKIAFDKYQKNNYDVILMDVQMPEMNGHEATQAIRKVEANSAHHISIIAMTASLLNTEINSCYEAGMDNYIPKPYKHEELVGRIYEEIKKA